MAKGLSLGLSTHRPAPISPGRLRICTRAAAAGGCDAGPQWRKGERLLDQGRGRAFCELLAEVDKFDLQMLSNVPKV